MKKTTGFIIFLLLFVSSTVDCILNPEEYPNLLSGSFTDGNTLSTGNTLPLVGTTSIIHSIIFIINSPSLSRLSLGI